MKSIYLHCPLLQPEDYQAVLQQLCPNPVRNVTVYTYAKQVTAKALTQLVEVQKSVGLSNSLRFRNILVLPQIPRFTAPVRRVLLKNSFTLELQVTPEQAPKLVKPVRQLTSKGLMVRLWVDAEENQRAVYDQFCRQGLPLHLQHPHYTEETADWFSQWLYDPHAQGINTFCDIISMLTLDTHSPNCRHSSCFGTTFRIDEELNVYLCPWQMDQRTYLGKLSPKAQLLQCDAVVKLLTDAVAKRQGCAGNCGGFAFCQGGCLLEADADNECVHYIATVDRIRESLLDIYRNQKLDQVNLVVKNAILNALAFGTAFFN